MSNFTIDFFELSFLAEACIPPQPIARTSFWHNLTDVYWHQLSENERSRLFEWLNRNWIYKQSLEDKNEDVLVFHARFNPENQYMVKTKFKGKEEEHRAFKLNDIYYIGRNKFIANEYIIETKLIEWKQQ